MVEELNDKEKTALGKMLGKKVNGIKWVLENKQPDKPDTLKAYNEMLEGLAGKLGVELIDPYEKKESAPQKSL